MFETLIVSWRDYSVKLSKAAIALALSVALAGTLAAAPQTKTTTTKAPAKAADQKSEQKTTSTAAAKPESVKPADLPKPVSDAVMKAYPKGTIASATKAMKGSDTSYKVSVKDAGKSHTLTLDAMGNPAPAAASKSKG